MYGSAMLDADLCGRRERGLLAAALYRGSDAGWRGVGGNGTSRMENQMVAIRSASHLSCSEELVSEQISRSCCACTADCATWRFMSGLTGAYCKKLSTFYFKYAEIYNILCQAAVGHCCLTQNIVLGKNPAKRT